MGFALMNVSHYLMFAYSDSRRALERIQDEEARQLLEHGLRAMQIAWGQSDALSLALERIGHRNHALYDGSWAEWGMYDDLDVAKG